MGALNGWTESSSESNPGPASCCDPVRLCLAVAVLVSLWVPVAVTYAGPYDFPPSNFNIMNADGMQMIGHGHYEVTIDDNGYANAFGYDRFNNGEYDVERDKLELRGDNQVPQDMASRDMEQV